MHDSPRVERHRFVRRLAVSAILGSLAAVACFGDNPPPGRTGDDDSGDVGGSAGTGGGKSGTGGSSGVAGAGAEAGDGEGGTAGKGGSSGSGGMSGKGGSAGTNAGGGGGEDTGPRCGNDVQDPGEECDDGNALDDDECSWNCKLGCAECHRDECSMLNDDVATYLEACYHDESLVEGGSAAGVATRAEVCSALVTCVHRTGCGETPDGDRALDPCYCAVMPSLCRVPATFVAGPCKVEAEEAAESTDVNEVFVHISDVSRPIGKAYAILNYCDNVLCRNQCFGLSGGGTGGMGGTSGSGGAGMNGGGMGGAGTSGGGGRGGAGAGGVAGSGTAGTGVAGGGMAGGGAGGTGGALPRCGDATLQSGEECESPVSVNPFPGNGSCSDNCQLAATPSCFTCETDGPCVDLVTGCRDFPTAAGRTACYDLLECFRDNPSCGAIAPEPCYCGAVPPGQCSALPPFPAANAPNGPCARQFEAAMGSTSPATVLVNFSNLSQPGAFATQRLLCDESLCPVECF